MQDALHLYAVTVSGSLYEIRPDEKRGGSDYEVVRTGAEELPLVGYGQGMVGIGKFLIAFSTESILLLTQNPEGFWERNARIARTSAVVAVFLDAKQAREFQALTSRYSSIRRFEERMRYRESTLAALRACKDHPAVVVNEGYWGGVFGEKV